MFGIVHKSNHYTRSDPHEKAVINQKPKVQIENMSEVVELDDAHASDVEDQFVAKRIVKVKVSYFCSHFAGPTAGILAVLNQN